MASKAKGINGHPSRNGKPPSDNSGADAAEKAVLATVLQAGRMVESASVLTAEDFRVFSHQLIWQAIINLAGQGKPTHTVNVAHFLEAKKQIGNLQNSPDVSYGYLGELLQLAFIPEGLFEYVAIVRENSDRRRLLLVANEIQAIARSRGPVKEQIEQIRKELSPFDKPSTDSPQIQPRWSPVLASQLAPEGAKVDWVWPGYLARKNITELTSLWKAGKSTLLAYLLKAMGHGDAVAGLSVVPGRALVISEESAVKWAERRDKLGIGDHCSFCIRPFLAKPGLAEWLDFVEHLARLTKAQELALVCFDTFFHLSPCRDENDAGQMNEALMPLVGICEAGAAVLLNHHPRKGDADQGQASRGSGVLPAFVDILLEMRRAQPKDRSSRQRVLTAYSRYDETPDELIIELAEDGSSYLSLGSKPEADRRSRWNTLTEILPGDPPGKTVEELLEVWPDERKPGKRTLELDLKQGAEAGRWSMGGEGKRGDPFRFWTAQNSIRAAL